MTTGSPSVKLASISGDFIQLDQATDTLRQLFDAMIEQLP